MHATLLNVQFPHTSLNSTTLFYLRFKMTNDAVTQCECLSKSAALTLIHANSKQPRSPAVTLEVPALPWPPDWWTPPRPPRRRWGWRCCSPRFWRACWAHSALRDVRPLTESVCGACLSAREPLCLDVLVFWSGELAVSLSVCVREQEPPPRSLALCDDITASFMNARLHLHTPKLRLFIHPLPCSSTPRFFSLFF